MANQIPGRVQPCENSLKEKTLSPLIVYPNKIPLFDLKWSVLCTNNIKKRKSHCFRVKVGARGWWKRAPPCTKDRTTREYSWPTWVTKDPWSLAAVKGIDYIERPWKFGRWKRRKLKIETTRYLINLFAFLFLFFVYKKKGNERTKRRRKRGKSLKCPCKTHMLITSPSFYAKTVLTICMDLQTISSSGVECPKWKKLRELDKPRQVQGPLVQITP